MLKKRIIPCLDVKNKKVTKGIKFQNNIVLGDPVEMAIRYSEGGCDELVFYDITASAERRKIDIGMVKDAARSIRIPFAVGGGIRGIEDMYEVLHAGAEKVSVNSLAVADPEIIRTGARAFGSQCIVLGMDPVRTADKVKFPSGYEITIRGFRERTGLDALEWALRAESLGAGEIVVNSVDADGTRNGFEIELTALIASNVHVPVVASGGGGTIAHIAEVLTRGFADAAIIASMIHTENYSLAQIKEELNKSGIPVRLRW